MAPHLDFPCSSRDGGPVAVQAMHLSSGRSDAVPGPQEDCPWRPDGGVSTLSVRTETEDRLRPQKASTEGSQGHLLQPSSLGYSISILLCL